MNATDVNTTCRVVDQAMQWTDSNGRLNVQDGDLILVDYRWRLVDTATYRPNRDLRVHVHFEGSNIIDRIEPSDWVTVRRYIIEETS